MNRVRFLTGASLIVLALVVLSHRLPLELDLRGHRGLRRRPRPDRRRRGEGRRRQRRDGDRDLVHRRRLPAGDDDDRLRLPAQPGGVREHPPLLERRRDQPLRRADPGRRPRARRRRDPRPVAHRPAGRLRRRHLDARPEDAGGRRQAAREPRQRDGRSRRRPLEDAQVLDRGARRDREPARRGDRRPRCAGDARHPGQDGGLGPRREPRRPRLRGREPLDRAHRRRRPPGRAPAHGRGDRARPPLRPLDPRQVHRVGAEPARGHRRRSPRRRRAEADRAGAGSR